MARHSRLEVLTEMLRIGAVPLFFDEVPARAAAIVEACSSGGMRVVEFTNRGDRALAVFDALAAQVAAHQPEVVLGIGSVVDAPTAALFIAAGADFVVSPSFNPEVARLCNRRRVAYLPGCATATEIGRAEELGAEIVKVFPGEVLGPAFVRAVLGPSPATRLMPTGGVEATAAGIAQWIDAGAACVGIGSKLIGRHRGPEDLERITACARDVVCWVAAARDGAGSGLHGDLHPQFAK